MVVKRKLKRQFGGKLNVYRARATMQKGYGSIPIFSKHRVQQGHGFGSLFRGLMKSIAPIAKRGLLSIGKEALSAGARAMGDIRDNKTSVRDAVKKQAVQSLHPQNIINRALKKRKMNSQSEKPRSKVRKTKKGVKTILDAPHLSRK